ncbi:hypothetical protein JCM5350_003877 [Sporobolomyces pararoseus]
MKTSAPVKLAVFAIVSTSTVFAQQLSSMRATIPGSLHQCERTNLFLFDTGNTRPISIALLPTSRSPKSSSTMTLKQAIAIGPLQMLNGIETPDAQAYDWQVSIASGEDLETWGFFPDGNGKNLNLPRTVMDSLPGAEKCQAATTESSKPGPGIKKATSGVILVGKAPPTFQANTTDSAIVVGAPISAVQTAVKAVSTSSLASAATVQPAASSVETESTTETASATSSPLPSSSSAETSMEKAQDSTNSASGQIMMKWLVGGLGLITSSLLI